MNVAFLYDIVQKKGKSCPRHLAVAYLPSCKDVCLCLDGILRIYQAVYLTNDNVEGKSKKPSKSYSNKFSINFVPDVRT